MHGTGTALGDPIEVGSFGEVVLAEGCEGSSLTCGGAKANLGHRESTAGMVGLLVLSLRLAAPNAQLRLLNPHVRSAMCTACCARHVAHC